ncbi:hypothetical protein N2152v2_006793 [Parachlorella kessleri]
MVPWSLRLQQPLGDPLAHFHTLQLLRNDTLPPGFDWRAYERHNPDLGTLTEASAQEHYLRKGMREGRIYRPLPMTVMYYTGLWTGLCNSFYSHLGALGLASTLGADLVVPPAWHRSSYAVLDPASWYQGTPADVLDLEAMDKYWQKRGGLRVHKASAGQTLTAKLQGPHEVPGVPYSSVQTRCLKLYLPGDRHFTLQPLQNVSRAVLARIQPLVRPLLAGGPQNLDSVCVLVHIGAAFTLAHGPSSLPILTDAARGLFFNRDIVAAAESIIQRLPPRYYGLHLRMEYDFEALGRTPERPLMAYVEVMRRAHFNASTPVYVASAIFNDMPEDAGLVKRRLRKRGVVGQLHYHRQFLDSRVRTGFKSEQLALLDFLVLERAERIVGFCQSSFSWYLREQRALRGVSKSTLLMVDGPQCSDPTHVKYAQGWIFTP